MAACSSTLRGCAASQSTSPTRSLPTTSASCDGRSARSFRVPGTFQTSCASCSSRCAGTTTRMVPGNAGPTSARMEPTSGNGRDGQAATAMEGPHGAILPVFIDARGDSASVADARPPVRPSNGFGPVPNGSPCSRTVDSGDSFSPASTSTLGASGMSISGSKRARCHRRLMRCGGCSPGLWTPPAKDGPPLSSNRSSTAVRARRSFGRPRRACAGSCRAACAGPRRSAEGQCAGVDPADIYRAAVRVVMRMVVVLFAESRELLPRRCPLPWCLRATGLLEELEKICGARRQSPCPLVERLAAGACAFPPCPPGLAPPGASGPRVRRRPLRSRRPGSDDGLHARLRSSRPPASNASS